MTAPAASSAIPGLAAARLWAAARFPYLASGIFGARVVAVPGIRTVAVDPGWRLWADPELTASRARGCAARRSQDLDPQRRCGD